MAVPVIMPRQGQSVETCIITQWHKKKGDPVKTGELLFSYETDKASFEAEAPRDGILLDTFYKEGDEVPVLVNVAIIGQPGEAPEELNTPVIPPVQDLAKPEKPVGRLTPEYTAERAESYSDQNRHAILRISPRARRMAEKSGIDPYTVSGTGPNGRIIARDVESVMSVQQEVNFFCSASAFTDNPLSNVRRIIARTMHESISNSAQLTHHMSADARAILALRAKIKSEAGKSGATNITINDMVCYAVIHALLKHPAVNGHFLGDKIRLFEKVHLGLAVDTPRGLMVASLQNASDLSLTGLSNQLRESAEQCRKGSINPELLSGTAATFTVSNLGNYGVEMFTPIINPPQIAILGVNTIIHRPADLGNGVFGFIPMIGLSLTYDHRAIDGGPATLFLKEIRELIANFTY